MMCKATRYGKYDMLAIRSGNSGVDDGWPWAQHHSKLHVQKPYMT